MVLVCDNHDFNIPTYLMGKMMQKIIKHDMDLEKAAGKAQEVENHNGEKE